MNKFTIVFLFLTMLTNAKGLTLKNAIEISLEKNFSILLQKSASQKSRNTALQGVGYLLPQVNLNGSIGYSGTNDLGESVTTSSLYPSGDYTTGSGSFAISTKWTLFDGFRMFYARRMVDIQAGQADIKERSAIEENVVSVISAYWAVVIAKNSLEIATAQVDISKDRFELVKTKRGLGSGSVRDLLSAEVDYNNDLSNVEEQKLSLEKAVDGLKFLLGDTSDVHITTSDSLKPMELNLDEDKLLTMSIENYSSLKDMKLNIEVAKELLGIQRASLSPIISAKSQYGYSKSVSKYSNLEQSTGGLKGSVGLDLTWPVFSGFSRTVGIKNAKEDLISSRISYEMYKENLKNSIHENYLDYKFYTKKIEYDKKSMEASKKNMEVSRELFKLGNITDIQFRQSQLALSSSRLAYLMSCYSQNIAVITLEKFAGILKIDGM